jgi:hypothetical protein
MRGTYNTLESNGKACRFIFAVSQGKRPLRKSRLRWEDIIKIGLRQIPQSTYIRKFFNSTLRYI